MRADELAEIRARAEAATPGPWWVEDGGPDSGWRIECDRGTVADLRVYTGNGDDALLLTRARADIPALLAEVERLRAALQHAVDHERMTAQAYYDKYHPDWSGDPFKDVDWLAGAEAALVGDSDG